MLTLYLHKSYEGIPLVVKTSLVKSVPLLLRISWQYHVAAVPIIIIKLKKSLSLEIHHSLDNVFHLIEYFNDDLVTLTRLRNQMLQLLF